MSDIVVPIAAAPFRATVTPPGSKSLTNRALILAADSPGGLMRYGSDQSSNCLSAVLMAAPYARNEVRVDLVGPQTSWPYVAMTMQLMDAFGHTPELERDPEGNPREIIVPRGK